MRRPHGRRPDLVYLTPDHVYAEVYERGYPIHPQDLVVEIVSEGQERRDYIEKRQEYAQAGIHRYWIVDLAARTVEIRTEGKAGRLPTKGMGHNKPVGSLFFPHAIVKGG